MLNESRKFHIHQKCITKKRELIILFNTFFCFFLQLNIDQAANYKRIEINYCVQLWRRRFEPFQDACVKNIYNKGHVKKTPPHIYFCYSHIAQKTSIIELVATNPGVDTLLDAFFIYVFFNTSRIKMPLFMQWNIPITILHYTSSWR